MKDIEKRLLPDVIVSEFTYIEGLLDVTSFLCAELTDFLTEENRFFGITKSYMNSIDLAFSKINKNTTDEDIDVYEKILYLYKPFIIKEFKRLKSKKLSPGDSIIVIIKKIIEIISGVEGFIYNKEIRTIRKIITKFYDNIKNKHKKDPLYSLSNAIKTYMGEGIIGKFNLSHISLREINIPKEKLEGSGVRVKEDSENKLIEVTWIGD